MKILNISPWITFNLREFSLKKLIFEHLQFVIIIEYWWSLCKIVKIVELLWKFIYNLKLYYRMLILIIKNKIGKIGFHKWSILKYSD